MEPVVRNGRGSSGTENCVPSGNGGKSAHFPLGADKDGGSGGNFPEDGGKVVGGVAKSGGLGEVERWSNNDFFSEGADVDGGNCSTTAAGPSFRGLTSNAQAWAVNNNKGSKQIFIGRGQSRGMSFLPQNALRGNPWIFLSGAFSTPLAERIRLSEVFLRWVWPSRPF